MEKQIKRTKEEFDVTEDNQFIINSSSDPYNIEKLYKFQFSVNTIDCLKHHALSKRIYILIVDWLLEVAHKRNPQSGFVTFFETIENLTRYLLVCETKLKKQFQIHLIGVVCYMQAVKNNQKCSLRMQFVSNELCKKRYSEYTIRAKQLQLVEVLAKNGLFADQPNLISFLSEAFYQKKKYIPSLEDQKFKLLTLLGCLFYHQVRGLNINKKELSKNLLNFLQRTQNFWQYQGMIVALRNQIKSCLSDSYVLRLIRSVRAQVLKQY